MYTKKNFEEIQRLYSAPEQEPSLPSPQISLDTKHVLLHFYKYIYMPEVSDTELQQTSAHQILVLCFVLSSKQHKKISANYFLKNKQQYWKCIM